MQPEAIIDFRSDNTGTAAPRMIEAIGRASRGTAAGYGEDEWTAALQRRFAELFEKEVRVFPVATGTAANALSLAVLGPSYGAIYCSQQAHINTSEANATGFFGAGVKLTPVAATHARIDADALTAALAAAGIGRTHESQPSAISVTQGTELGTVYGLDEVRAIGDLARRYRLRLHMDGARFANALTRLGCTPAEASWKAGVDILSFGATKNGGLLCDAIVVFAPELAAPLAFHLQRAGQVWSKMRFAAMQLLAYVEDGAWLDTARQANDMARRLERGIAQLPGARLLAPVEANMLFLETDPAVLDGLETDGVRFFRRRKDLARLVCRFDVTEAEVDALLASLRRHLRAPV